MTGGAGHRGDFIDSVPVPKPHIFGTEGTFHRSGAGYEARFPKLPRSMLTAQQVADAVFNPGSKTPSYKTCALRPHPAS
ncbi:MAG: hypothetical protein CXZ00_13640 [Acidobacteria bacterium]|nr:MAG: hypothetical protein CXZ00_13640 [Acidobacteriota bacterium]